MHTSLKKSHLERHSKQRGKTLSLKTDMPKEQRTTYTQNMILRKVTRNKAKTFSSQHLGASFHVEL